jgi:hypothetical protein|tara:strand:- start:314 stop:664 length:351 start_codon:yes stop_codon:yes gene_type:complete
MNKVYLITINNKKFNEWAKQMKKKLKGAALDHFNGGYNEVFNSNYLARASFVCYWEIHGNGSLAKLAPALTQASLIHMLHRFIELEAHQEVEVVSMMIQNFLALLAKLGGAEVEEE